MKAVPIYENICKPQDHDAKESEEIAKGIEGGMKTSFLQVTLRHEEKAL